jgi:RNA polymerase sigma-70 factor (ECF subfamily)
MASLSSILLAQLQRRGVAGSATEGMEDTLRALVATGRAAWPEIAIETSAFVRYLADRLDLHPDLEAALQAVRAKDLYLAFGCAQGDARAIAAFERTLLSRIPTFLARLDPSRDLADEVAQELRKELLVPGNASAGIAVYSGRGDLGGWLRVVSIRTAQRLRRRSNLPAGLAAGRAEQSWRDADPEQDYLKLRYGAAYEEAFHAALASLSSRERLCLRLHYADGLDIGRIGRLYKIHRSTVARRLAEYRRKLRESVKERLRKRLKLTDSEYESVLSLVRSQMVVSLRSALKNPAHPAKGSSAQPAPSGRNTGRLG